MEDECIDETESDLESSTGRCSGESELDPARRSSSSRRFFSFLPVRLLESCLISFQAIGSLTVVALSYAVLYLATLDRISDLGPVLVPGGRGEALRGRSTAVDCDTDRPQGQCVVTHESRIGR